MAAPETAPAAPAVPGGQRPGARKAARYSPAGGTQLSLRAFLQSRRAMTGTGHHRAAGPVLLRGPAALPHQPGHGEPGHREQPARARGTRWAPTSTGSTCSAG